MGQYGNTALHYAVIDNSLEMAQLLLAAKAAVDVQDNVRLPADGFMLSSDSAAVGQGGYTLAALHFAARNDSLEMARLLLASKAAVNVQTNVRAPCKWLHAVF